MKMKNGFLMRELAGRYVVVPVGTDTNQFRGMVQMNKVGAFLWESLQSEKDKEELIRELLDKYQVDRERAERDVDIFINKLEAAGILEV